MKKLTTIMLCASMIATTQAAIYTVDGIAGQGIGRSGNDIIAWDGTQQVTLTSASTFNSGDVLDVTIAGKLRGTTFNGWDLSNLTLNGSSSMTLRDTTFAGATYSSTVLNAGDQTFRASGNSLFGGDMTGLTMNLVGAAFRNGDGALNGSTFSGAVINQGVQSGFGFIGNTPSVDLSGATINFLDAGSRAFRSTTVSGFDFGGATVNIGNIDLWRDIADTVPTDWANALIASDAGRGLFDRGGTATAFAGQTLDFAGATLSGDIFADIEGTDSLIIDFSTADIGDITSSPDVSGYANIEVLYSPGTTFGTFTEADATNAGWSISTPSGPPTLAPEDIVDDQSGGPINDNLLVTYILTFSTDMDDTTVDASDFNNAGTATVNFGNIMETASGVFSVEVTPTSTGTLQLRIPAGAVLKDANGEAMDTTSGILDDTTITVNAGPADNTPPNPDPMTFAVAPYLSSGNSVVMEASVASDSAGVEYYFEETSGNPGGDDSGWQLGTTYEDTGLTLELTYTYRVKARDLSANQNVTQPSAPVSLEIPLTPPSTITLTSPTSRHIVQRSTANTGNIAITGTYTSSPSGIQARVVVMAGSGNSGTTTAWQTIDIAPTGGTFSGTLTDVPAGGWYQLEVRGLVEGVPGIATVLQKVGVGDVYLTAGQSNSGNFGDGGYTCSDDRVSARTTVSGSTWIHAADPLPIADGNGGCVWTRLGDLLTAVENIPIGFVTIGKGSSQVNSWTPGQGNYDGKLKPTVQSFPTNGFRSFLWHQGETDSTLNTDTATQASRLTSMITQSRIDAGWNIPWYLAEVSFHHQSSLSQEMPVAAGERLVVHSDPLVFLGPSTDEFHLEDGNGGKLNGGVHFNYAGLLDHAQQWRDILRGNTTITPRNGNFEDNRTPAISDLAPLADGVSNIVDITTNDSPAVIGWRILSASGTVAADGDNGFHNPTTGTFAGAVDTVNGGVLPNMDGRHVAMLDGGSASNYFLHSTRAPAVANTVYTLTAAIGVRDNPSAFGTARLEITANGAVVASASFDKAALDAIRGSDAAGSFTDASISWTTGATVTNNQPLAIRIVKEGGSGTVIDFDNARLTSEAVPTAYDLWVALYPTLSNTASDHDEEPDGMDNLLEYALGGNPTNSDAASILPVSIQDENYLHYVYSRQNPKDPALSYTVLSTTNLVDAPMTNATIEAGVSGVSNGFERVTNAVSTATEPQQFMQLKIQKD